MIKQRVLDELFDDPVRKSIKSKKKGGDIEDTLNYYKSTKGLGDMYEDDLKQKVYSEDPNSFLANPGAHAGETSIKKEVSELMGHLFRDLDRLS